MSLHTRKKCLANESLDRKANRIIATLLESRDPDLHAELLAIATRVIREDNENPLSQVVTRGLDTVHFKSQRVRDAEKARTKYLKSIT